MIKASIDIGSNSVRLLIANVIDNKIVEIIYQDKATTRLASNIDNTNILNDIAINNTIQTLAYYKEKAQEFSATSIKTIATSAVREAKNKLDFINKAKDIGLDIDIISGEDEGYIEFLGVSAGMPVEDSTLIIDIGGGSTELIYNNSNDINIESFKLGVVRLAEQFNYHIDNISDINKCNQLINDVLNQSTIIRNNISKIIATAGTSTTIASIDLKLVEYDWQKINGHIINKLTIENILSQIINTSINNRLSIIGMDPGREDVLIPGILIILYIMNTTNINSITISDFGLLEGAIILP